MGVGGAAEQVLRLRDLVQVLAPVLDPVPDQLASDLLPHVGDRDPGDVERRRVERPRSDLSGGDLRQVLGGVDDLGIGDRSGAIGFFAHVVENLDLDFVLCVKVLPLNPDNVEPGVAEGLQGLLLEIALLVDADATVVYSIVDPRCVLLLSG